MNIKDIQGLFTKYHEQLEAPEEESAEAIEFEEPEQPFLPGDGMPTTEVPSLVTSSQIREAMDRIAADLQEKDEVYRLVERSSGWVLATSPTVGEWIRLLRDEPRPLKLNQSALETLAVISYRQPVVRAEIEKIRGVSVDAPLSRLLERDLVEIVGRADLPGRPIQYGTTEEFLNFLGIRSLEELPASDVLAPRQIDEWLHVASQREDVTEREMGLPEGERDEAESLDEASDTLDDAEVAEENLDASERSQEESLEVLDSESEETTREEAG